MNRIIQALLVAAGVLFALPAGAETIRRSLPAGDTPEVRIINAVGDIVVRGEATDTIDIDADLGRDVERLDVTERGDVVIIEAIYEGRGWRSDGTDLKVTLPKDGRVSVEGVSADVTVSGVRGEIRVVSVSGDVEVETFGGLLEATSTSGDVDIRALAGRLEATTVSGDVTIREGQLDRVRTRAVSGDVRVLGVRADDADIDANAVSGNVEVVLGSAFGGRIDVSTLNGSIDNCFVFEDILEDRPRRLEGADLLEVTGDRDERLGDEAPGVGGALGLGVELAEARQGAPGFFLPAA